MLIGFLASRNHTYAVRTGHSPFGISPVLPLIIYQQGEIYIPVFTASQYSNRSSVFVHAFQFTNLEQWLCICWCYINFVSDE